MKKLLLLILLSTPVFAGQKYGFKDAHLDDEMANNYKEHSFPNWVNARGSTATITNINASTITAITGTFTNLNAPSINGTFIGLGRNRIINGDMLLDQRNEGALVTVNASADIYGVDRWWGFGTGAAGVFKTQRLTTTPPTGFTYYTHITVTTADATPAAGSVYLFGEWLEGFAVRDFLFGSANAVTVTISFWVRSSQTGNFTVSLQSAGVARSYPARYTVNATNTWEKKTVTLVGDTSGTYTVSNTNTLAIFFDIGSGSSVEGTNVTWQAGGKYRINGDARTIASTSNTIDFTGIQLEIGSTATSFEFVSFPLQFMQCQRYCTKNFTQGVVPANNTAQNHTWNATAYDTGHIRVTVPFPVPMRAVPTITYYSTSLNNNNGQWGYYNAGWGNPTTTATSEISDTAISVEMAKAATYTANNSYLAAGYYFANADF